METNQRNPNIEVNHGQYKHKKTTNLSPRTAVYERKFVKMINKRLMLYLEASKIILKYLSGLRFKSTPESLVFYGTQI